MQRRVQLQVSNEQRRVRDIIQKADQLRRDEAYSEPGGSYSGGGSNISNYGGFSGLPSGYGSGEIQCIPLTKAIKDLIANGDGSFSAPDGGTIGDVFFDGLNATGNFTVNPDGSVTPKTNLVEGTEVTGAVY